MLEREIRTVELKGPQSPQIKEIQMLAILESRGQPITEMHLLLAILREGSASAALDRHGITLGRIRYHVDHHNEWGAKDEQFVSFEEFQRGEEQDRRRREQQDEEARRQREEAINSQLPQKHKDLFKNFRKQKKVAEEPSKEETSQPAKNEIEKKRPLLFDPESRVKDLLERVEAFAKRHGREGDANPIDLLLVMLEDPQYPTTLILRRTFLEPEAFSIVKMRGHWTQNEKTLALTHKFPQFSTGDVVRTPETAFVPTSIEGLQVELMELLRPENEEKRAVGKAIARAKEKKITLFEYGIPSETEAIEEEKVQPAQIEQEPVNDEIQLTLAQIEQVLRDESIPLESRENMRNALVEHFGILKRRYSFQNGSHPNGSISLRNSS